MFDNLSRLSTYSISFIKNVKPTSTTSFTSSFTQKGHWGTMSMVICTPYWAHHHGIFWGMSWPLRDPLKPVTLKLIHVFHMQMYTLTHLWCTSLYIIVRRLVTNIWIMLSMSYQHIMCCGMKLVNASWTCVNNAFEVWFQNKFQMYCACNSVYDVVNA